ncbi:MAG: hypothetical protein HND47_17120 [Chloroflexi bacterium]|nr:hypothetical protein [Chloroflexota bacterium]
MVAGTAVLPQLSPFLMSLTDITIPTSAPELQALMGDVRSILIIGAFLVLTFIVAIAAGLIWNAEKWFKTALVFWVPYVILYTTVFTNSNGFFTGVIGSLGYWIVQHDVERGSQPWYYYLLIQVPVYEFLPALGFILALFIGLRRKLSAKPKPAEAETAAAGVNEADDVESPDKDEADEHPKDRNFANVFSLLVWWSVSSFFAFSFAGERMPWLTVHITLPLILITGWALGHLVDALDWEKLKQQNVPLTLTALAIFIASTGRAILLANGPPRPFRGQGLEQLQATNAFLLPVVVSIASAAASVYFLRTWTMREFRNVFVLTFFGFLAVLTMRAAFRASYITYDQATEFLVYAHASTAVKEVMAQAEEISRRTTGGLGVAIAYDASPPDTGVSWPVVWYLRDYTNQRSFAEPTRSPARRGRHYRGREELLTRSSLPSAPATTAWITSACGGPCRITSVWSASATRTSPSPKITPAAGC